MREPLDTELEVEGQLSELAGLVSADDKEFEYALIALKKSGQLQEPNELYTAITAIEHAALLSTNTRRDRILRTLRYLDIRPEIALAASSKVTAATPITLAALRAFLPERYRGMTFQEHGQPKVEVQPPETRQFLKSESSREEDTYVVLLGSINEFGTTQSLVTSIGLLAHLAESIEDVPEHILVRTCGVIVGESRYAKLTGQEQRQLLQKVARSNSQAWLKFGARSLSRDLNQDLNELRLSLGFTRDRAASVHITDISEVSQTELGYLTPFAAKLSSNLSPALLVDGLSERQAALVSHAVWLELDLLTLSELIGNPISVTVFRGKSGATMLICRVVGCLQLFALRLGSRESLLDGPYAELPKIKHLIQPWSDVVPRVYNVAGDAVLVYGAVRSAFDPSKPAITLADRLDQLQALEPPDAPISRKFASDAQPAIREAFELLASLNRTTVSGTKEPFAYVQDHFLSMSESGRAFEADEVHDNAWFISTLCRAVEIVDRSTAQSVNHGDPHVRNILLPSSGHAELIDFERAQLGHPLYDICHLTISIASHAFREYMSFEKMVDLFYRHLFTSPEDSEDIFRAASAANSLVTHALDEARITAGQLRRHYQLAECEFSAMLVVVCSMALMYLPQLHASVVKAMFVASGERLGEVGS